MELHLIGVNKLKVTLTPDDMSQYALTCDTIDYDNTTTRRAFWDILDKARSRTGFDAASDRVFIQVYPNKSGGGDMYVTKISALSEEQKQSLAGRLDERNPFAEKSIDKADGTDESLGREYLMGESKSNLPSEPQKTVRAGISVFGFSELTYLLDACRRLKAAGYSGISSAYSAKKSDLHQVKYYLAVTEHISYFSVGGSAGLSECSILDEYGRRLGGHTMVTYVKEHADCICDKNAVDTLSVL